MSVRLWITTLDRSMTATHVTMCLTGVNQAWTAALAMEMSTAISTLVPQPLTEGEGGGKGGQTDY